MHIIKRIYNNNVVLAIDDGGEEVVVAGAGVGYLANRGEPVDDTRVERVFHRTGLTRSGAFRVLLELPFPVLRATTRISAHLRERHGVILTPAVEVALADHLAQAVSRSEQDQPLYNSMLWETKMTYPAEFAIALEVLDVAHAELGVRLPLDEAGFVTLHLVNAGLASNPQQAIALGKALHDVVAIVERRLGISVEGSTASSTRFLTHVKFVIQRLTRSQAYHGSFDEMFRTFKRENPGIYDCAAEIGSYLEGAFSTHLTEEEHLYLMLHLRRLQDDVAQPGATGPPAGEA